MSLLSEFLSIFWLNYKRINPVGFKMIIEALLNDSPMKFIKSSLQAKGKIVNF